MSNGGGRIVGACVGRDVGRHEETRRHWTRATNVAGGGARRLTSWPSDQARASWSRDGRSIYFGSNRTGRYEVWKAPLPPSGEVTPSQALQLTHDSGFEAYESEDGKQVYYVPPNRNHTLRSIPAAGGASALIIADKLAHGWWALARGGVYFMDVQSSPKVIYFHDLSSRLETAIASVASEVNPMTPDFCISADGRRLIYGQVDLSNTDLKVLENVQ